MWQHLTLYPDVPSARRSQILRDLLVLALIAFFVWIGFKVHDLVAALAVLGHGVTEAGNSVQGAFDSVGDAVSNVPVVGGALGRRVPRRRRRHRRQPRRSRPAGRGRGASSSRAPLGIVTALLPIAVLLVAVLPRRIRTIREMSSARAVSSVDLDDPERRRLLAMRAAFGLPYRELLPWTKDPFGDLAAGNYDALVVRGAGRRRTARAEEVPRRHLGAGMSGIGTRAPDLSVETVVRRTPDAVWDAVADPRRIASWSPEARGVSGHSGATGPVPVGTTFSGSNRHGFFRWTTRCVVVESTPGEAFAFDVTYLGRSVARWRYSLTAVDAGTGSRSSGGTHAGSR